MKKAYGEWVYTKDIDYLLSMPYEVKRKAQLKLYKEDGIEENEALKIVDKDVEVQDYLLTLEQDAHNGKCLHFFFKGVGFCDWLESCSTPITEEMSEIGERFIDDRFGLPGGTPIMFHFEKGNSPVYLICWELVVYTNPNTKERTNAKAIYAIDNKKRSFFMIPKLARPDGFDNAPDVIVNNRRIISSAMAYIQAFPETVKDGIPEDISSRNHFKHMNAITVSVSKKVITHEGPCPHYRTGHFRLLSDERYINKKGQVVFVHGCFVKGKAKTVSEMD